MRCKVQSKGETSKSGKLKDMYIVVCDVIVNTQPPAGLTVFKLNEQEVFNNLLDQMKRECPTLVKTLVAEGNKT
jgi:hypothetical protein